MNQFAWECNKSHGQVRFFTVWDCLQLNHLLTPELQGPNLTNDFVTRLVAINSSQNAKNMYWGSSCTRKEPEVNQKMCFYQRDFLTPTEENFCQSLSVSPFGHIGHMYMFHQRRFGHTDT